MSSDKRYWIAINGSGCALAPFPFKNAITAPVAQQYFGFPTYEEAKEAQRICLHEPISKVKRWMQSLAPDVACGRVIHKTPKNPDPQTRGPTAWMEDEGELPKIARHVHHEARWEGTGVVPLSREQQRRQRQAAKKEGNQP